MQKLYLGAASNMFSQYKVCNWIWLKLLYWRSTKSWLLREIVLVLPLSWEHAVSGSCSCSTSKRGKRNTSWSWPTKRQMIASFPLASASLVPAFPLQLCQSGSQSMGFPLVSFGSICGWPWVWTQTSPSSSRTQWCRSSRRHMETIIPAVKPGVPHQCL